MRIYQSTSYIIGFDYGKVHYFKTLKYGISVYNANDVTIFQGDV